jgi:putative endonuclease
MYYVYVIQSLSHPNQHYTGITENLNQRLVDHNEGRSVHTNKFKPWKIIVAIRFDNERKARAFEKYLKTGSGRAFMKRHFL